MEIRYMEIAQSETAYPAFIVGEIMFLCHWHLLLLSYTTFVCQFLFWT